MNGGKITYHQQVSYCGKPRCRRCREGIGHGPYWYAYQTVNGRTIRTYVGKHPPAEMQMAPGEMREPVQAPELAGCVVRLYALGRSRPATSDLLLTQHATLVLADQARLWIDASAFDSLLGQARTTGDPGQTEQLLEEAMLLYGGDYLPEERDIPWIQTRREAL